MILYFLVFTCNVILRVYFPSGRNTNEINYFDIVNNNTGNKKIAMKDKNLKDFASST